MTVLQRLLERDLLDLLDDVCRRHHVTREELCGRGRTRMVTFARQDFWWRLRNHEAIPFSYLEIGRLFDRDHVTVLRGVRAFEVARARFLGRSPRLVQRGAHEHEGSRPAFGGSATRGDKSLVGARVARVPTLRRGGAN